MSARSSSDQSSCICSAKVRTTEACMKCLQRLMFRLQQLAFCVLTCKVGRFGAPQSASCFMRPSRRSPSQTDMSQLEFGRLKKLWTWMCAAIQVTRQHFFWSGRSSTLSTVFAIMGNPSQYSSPLDPIVPPLFNALILCFPCLSARGEAMVGGLQESLSITVHERPYLAGEVVSRGSPHHSTTNARPGELSLEESSSGTPDIRIQVNDMTQPGHGWEYSYLELREAGMPVGKLDGAFLAPLSGYNTTTKVMAAQANLIDGGCLLSVYFLHSFVDAFGASLVMGAWAENCRKVQEGFASPPRTPELILAGAESTSAALARLSAPKTLQLPSVLDKTSLSPTLRQE